MTKSPIHTADTAPAASKATPDTVKGAFGFEPNLQANMAASPKLLAGFSTLWDLFSKTTLTPAEQQIVHLTANYENECRYCMAGHIMLSKTQEIDDAVEMFLAAGSTQQNVLEVVLGAGTKLLSNETNYIAHTQLDAFMAGAE